MLDVDASNHSVGATLRDADGSVISRTFCELPKQLKEGSNALQYGGISGVLKYCDIDTEQGSQGAAFRSAVYQEHLLYQEHVISVYMGSKMRSHPPGYCVSPPRFKEAAALGIKAEQLGLMHISNVIIDAINSDRAPSTVGVYIYEMEKFQKWRSGPYMRNIPTPS
ncbi:unnamed protein product [Haemonchus placei]|uniref:RNase H domain-containing protein n=1 Tax=Haemonchus placei TaxID=6290 RepID=A0A0N4WQS6_HAEPC|nr:unnamed protein product [Haemonchus placei]